MKGNALDAMRVRIPVRAIRFQATIAIGILILVSIFPPNLQAGGQYHIGKDQGGIYMQTDQNGSWYIDPTHLDHFAVGETGRYTIGSDPGGTFIQTGRGAKYYINLNALDEWERERETFNARHQAAGTETKVDLLDGVHILVPVALESNGHRIQARMLLDTGASIMVLHRKVADRLHLKSAGKAKLLIAGGKILDSDIVSLDTVGVGPIKKKGLQASVIPHKRPRGALPGAAGHEFFERHQLPHRFRSSGYSVVALIADGRGLSVIGDG